MAVVIAFVCGLIAAASISFWLIQIRRLDLKRHLFDYRIARSLDLARDAVMTSYEAHARNAELERTMDKTEEYAGHMFPWRV